MNISTLQGVDFDEIHRAFKIAFSDYVVPFSPTPEQLLELLTRRGWRPDLSVGAFHDQELIGFALNALEGVTAYNSGTGVVPSHRRGHVASEIMRTSADVLRGAGAQRYVLEVIASNTAARALYTRMGFKESRHLQSWTYEGSRKVPPFPPGPSLTLGMTHQSMWDINPSWQNSVASIRRSRAEYVVLGDERGYAVIFPATGDLAQLAVAKANRRRGVGRRLLESAASVAGKPLRIMNIDAGDRGVARFLESCGARPTVEQIEMIAVIVEKKS